MEVAIAPALESEIRARLEPDAHVVALHRGGEPMRPVPAVLNKALVVIMAKLGAVRFERGRLIYVTRQGAQFEATCVEPATSTGLYDRVIARHGPDAEHVRKSLGRRLAEACGPLGGVVAALGLTDSLDRTTDEFFSRLQS